MTFVLFGGDDYYAAGGMSDYLGCYPSADAAMQAAALMLAINEAYAHPDWFQVAEFVPGDGLQWVAKCESGSPWVFLHADGTEAVSRRRTPARPSEDGGEHS